MLVLFGWILHLAWPALLPTGRGSDLTHHLLLTDYIERHWRLVHDPALAAVMGEMAHYTPGSHLLAALTGVWTGTNALRAFFPLLAACAALTAGFVFLIARRLVPAPFALISVMLLLLPLHFFVGAFTRDGFLAQAISSLFAVFMWWAIVVWDEQPSPAIAAAIGIAAARRVSRVAGVDRPSAAGICARLLARAGSRGRSQRVRHAAIVLGPLFVIAAVHAAGRLEWVQLVRSSGGALAPSIATVGWAFPLIAVAGIAVVDYGSSRPHHARLVDRARGAGRHAVARGQGQRRRDAVVASKPPYLASTRSRFSAGSRSPATGQRDARTVTGARPEFTGWGLALLLMVTSSFCVSGAPRRAGGLYRSYPAGQSARDHVGATCVDYLLADADTAFSLHLAVLGNRAPRPARPRSIARSARGHRPLDRLGWGAGYAIVDRG